MKFVLFLFFIFFYSFNVYADNDLNGDYSISAAIEENCDFIGEARININYNFVSIKAQKWQWKDSGQYKLKSFKGKFKKDYSKIAIFAKEIGSKHSLSGTVENNKISLIFSSTHEEANNRYGGCSFEFSKD